MQLNPTVHVGKNSGTGYKIKFRSLTLSQGTGAFLRILFASNLDRVRTILLSYSSGPSSTFSGLAEMPITIAIYRIGSLGIAHNQPTNHPPTRPSPVDPFLNWGTV